MSLFEVLFDWSFTRCLKANGRWFYFAGWCSSYPWDASECWRQGNVTCRRIKEPSCIAWLDHRELFVYSNILQRRCESQLTFKTAGSQSKDYAGTLTFETGYSHFEQLKRAKATDWLTDQQKDEPTDRVTDLTERTERLGLTGRATDKVPFEKVVFNACVPFVIYSQIWMLTGDKLETATCIAQSSRLVARNQTIYTFKQVSLGFCIFEHFW